MALPPRKFKPKKAIKKRTKPRRVKAIKCRPHINWILENWKCLLYSRVSKLSGVPHMCEGPLDPHHTPTRGAGGGDDNVVPLCRKAHAMIDSPGNSEKSVQAMYGVDFRETAAKLWDISPPGRVYRYKQERENT